MFVDPLRIGIVPSRLRDTHRRRRPRRPPARSARRSSTLLAELGCDGDTDILGNNGKTAVTVLDLVLASISGAGALTVELGGVQATTARASRVQRPRPASRPSPTCRRFDERPRLVCPTAPTSPTSADRRRHRAPARTPAAPPPRQAHRRRRRRRARRRPASASAPVGSCCCSSPLRATAARCDGPSARSLWRPDVRPRPTTPTRRRATSASGSGCCAATARWPSSR